MSVPQMTVEDLKKKIEAKENFVLLDVREANELDICKLETFTHIPLGDLETRYNELNKETEIAVLCRSGGRSAQATGFLKSQGYKAVNVAGGILEWGEKFDPSMEQY
jgi:rhodanese-related sulfurtransferase